jgi:hypothetical protein
MSSETTDQKHSFSLDIHRNFASLCIDLTDWLAAAVAAMDPEHGMQWWRGETAGEARRAA